MSKIQQNLLFRGIYEFEDPSGCLIAARIPHKGSADLYSDSAILVRPNQWAMLVYKGQVSDVLNQGTHFIKTENIPIITRLANWRFGFKSPLRCEIWFFANHLFTARRWGTAQPIIHSFQNLNSVPLRAYGNYNFQVKDPKIFFSKIIGSRSGYDVSELEDFIQGQLLELLPEALNHIDKIEILNKSQNKISKILQDKANRTLLNYGVEIKDLQILSIIPSKEIIEALDAKKAMEIIGNKQEYLLYKAANSLGEISSVENKSNDPMQMMLGMMLGKNLMVADFREKERTATTIKGQASQLINSKSFCSNCGSRVRTNDNFCSSCGEKLK